MQGVCFHEGATMLRKMAGAVVILGLAFGIANAETLKGVITKIDPTAKTLTFKEKGGEPKEYKISKDCKVCMMKKGEKEPVAEGLTAKQLSKIDESKGRFAAIEVTDGKVTEIVLLQKKKKKDN
jgi:hypothetical protein